MKSGKKLLAGCLAFALVLPMAGCKKKAAFKMPTEDDFYDYVTKDLEAKDVSDGDLYDDPSELPWDTFENGIARETSTWTSPSQYENKDGSVFSLAKMSNVKQFFYPITRAGAILKPDNDRGFDETTLEKEICYLKYGFDLSSVGTFKSSKGEEKVFTSTQHATCAILLTFDKDKNAEEYFSEAARSIFEDRSEMYEQSLQKLMDQPKIAAITALSREEPDFRDRNIYDFDDLPEDVYSLDKKAGTGYFRYSIDDQWIAIPDIYKTEKVPEAGNYNQVHFEFSLLLEADRVMIVFSGNSYEEYPSDNIYYEDWEKEEFKEDKTLKQIYKKFGITDPNSIKLDDDLSDQLIFVTRTGNAEYELHIKELYEK